MFTYDRFIAGTTYGAHRFEVTAGEVRAWQRLFAGETEEWMPPGMVSVIAMRAYLGVVTPRPPGNIHGASKFEIRRRIRIGETVTTTVACENKELCKGRRLVYISLRSQGEDGLPVFDASITSIVSS